MNTDINSSSTKPQTKNDHPIISSSIEDEDEKIKNSKKEIQISFDNWTKAWNEGNTETYLTAYADLPSTRYVSGTNVTIGKENIVQLMRERGGAKGILSIHDPSTSFHIDILPNQDDAICFGQYELELPHVDSKQHGCFTVHVRKLEGVWKIISDHSS